MIKTFWAAAGIASAAALGGLAAWLWDLRGDMIAVRQTDALNAGFRAGMAFAKAQEKASAQARHLPEGDPVVESSNPWTRSERMREAQEAALEGITALEEAAFTELVQLGQDVDWWEDVAGELLCSVCWTPIVPRGLAQWQADLGGWTHPHPGDAQGCA
jgi:hypothetical protein